MTLIRHSFNATSWAVNSPKATPKSSKAVKLKRPSTTRHLAAKPQTASPSARSVPRPSTLFTSLAHSSPTAACAPRRSDLNSLVLIPRSATSKRTSKRTAKQTIINLQTLGSCKRRTHNCISRSLSVKGDSHRSSDSLTLSFTDISHHLDCDVTVELKEGLAALPHPLTQFANFEKVFGRPMRHKSKRDALKAFITNSLRVEINSSSHVTVAYRPSTSEISVIITGTKAPLSACCGSAVVFSFSDPGGKVLCTASYCPTRTISNFHIPVDLRTALWSPLNERKKGDCKLRRSDRKVEVGAGLFTNEKLKHVSPSRATYSSLGRVPVLLQIPSISPVPGQSHISATPLQEVLKRANSRHNTVRARETTAEVLQQLSALLKAD